MIAAHTMIARSLAGMITREACTIASAIVPTHAGATSAAIAAAVATTTTVAATATASAATTFGIRGTDRRDIGRQQCRCAECQSTRKDGHQGFSHVVSPPKAQVELTCW
ncbi:conserved protein of unknown function [Pseudomonas inefficax]|uniref:Uncharacterized protein n=1 Tax=Pseudomonas inefficax TaxID=2078786 RepID=A0AAQ1PAS1_9PSED|nr:conserved protein of unknown function [Pseudomonas inefficax]